MAKTSRSQDALHQLLDERKRYEQWLATLESRRESTAEHVYQRVHADYEQRLASVRDQLKERTGDIRSSITTLNDRLKEATEQEAARVDELHEAELRALVGEFTSEQWELRKREVEIELKQFVDDKKKLSDELNQLLLIMEQIAAEDAGAGQTPAGTAAEAAPAAEPAVTPPSMPTFTPAAEAPVTPPPAAATAADATRVRSKTPARSRAAMHNAPRADETAKPSVPIESLAPSDGLPAQVDSVPGEPAAVTGSTTPVASATAAVPPPPAPADAGGSAAGKTERSSLHAKRGKTSGFAHAPPDARRENEKTLKCAECGAMNYPTEWYCESCGGELSAL